MNVASLLDRVYSSTTYNDRYRIVDMFNDGMSQLTDDAKIEANSTVTLVVDQENYPLPTGFKSPISLIDGTIANPNFIYPLLNINEYRFGYSIFDGEIYLKPAPSEVKTINFHYYKVPATLVLDTDVPEFESIYHYLLSSYAIYMISLLPNSEVPQGKADLSKTQWMEGLQMFTQSIARKNKRSRVNEKVVW